MLHVKILAKDGLIVLGEEERESQSEKRKKPQKLKQYFPPFPLSYKHSGWSRKCDLKCDLRSSFYSLNSRVLYHILLL